VILHSTHRDPLMSALGDVWTYMDPARLQQADWIGVQQSQLLTYIRLLDAAREFGAASPDGFSNGVVRDVNYITFTRWSLVK
jgi:hypothetical protein